MRIESEEKYDTGGYRCPITKAELKAFIAMAAPGTRLLCRRPRHRNDEEIVIDKMTVLRRYPFIVALSYTGAYGKTLTTSATWAEVIIQNRPKRKKKSKA